MRGFSVMEAVGYLLIAISLIQIFSFRLSISNDIDAWRLTRIAMVQANLMASEHFQQDIGVVGELPVPAKSDGYTVTAVLYDPESDRIVDGELWYEAHLLGKDISGTPSLEYADGMRMPRTSFGYAKVEDLSADFEWAKYALPVVYGNGRYGVLLVFMSAQDDEDWQPQFQDVFQNARGMYVENWGES
jgi:hypothetical protein